MMQSSRFNEFTGGRQAGPFPKARLSVQQFLPMVDKRESESGSEARRPRFTTIDDLRRLAEDLVAGLNRLGEYKHPLDIRRGLREGVRKMAIADESQSVKAGGKTYFFDIKRSNDGRPYLVITESRFKGEGKDRERASIVVFPEHAQEFLETLQGMVAKLG